MASSKLEKAHAKTHSDVIKLLKDEDSEFYKVILWDSIDEEYKALRIPNIDPCYVIGKGKTMSEMLRDTASTLNQEDGIKAKEKGHRKWGEKTK